MSPERDRLQQRVRNGEVIADQSFGRLSLEHGDLSGAIFERTTFSGTRLARAHLRECVFNACRFTDVDLSNADLSKSV